MTTKSSKYPIVAPMPIDWDNLEVAPWERLPGESARAFEAFAAYRDMGPTRSQKGAADKIERSFYTIKDFAKRWHWGRRAEAWERYMDAIARQSQIDAVADMNERHARTAMMILSKVGQRLVGSEVDGVRAIDLNTLTATDLARLTEVATKVERLARGAESDRVGLHQVEEVTVKVAFDTEPIYPQGADHLAPALPVLEGEATVKQLGPGEDDYASEQPASAEEATTDGGSDGEGAHREAR